MGKIDKNSSNLYAIPKGAFIRNKSYVYINISNKYVSPDQKKEKGTRGYTGHDSICIGVIQNQRSAKGNMFYANKNYLTSVLKQLPDPPKYADSRSVGLNAWIKTVVSQWTLAKDLADVFGTQDAQLVLDLAAYMISRESAVMQHFPAWARDHVIFSENIFNDTCIGRFLRDTLTIPKINLFKEKWASKNIGDGKIYLCYDSTNVNSQAEGVFIVQKGHAKDDPTLNQVNTDYVVRQSDGLPITYLHSPGSVTDIAQAQEMLQFIKRAIDLVGKIIQLVLICDRGYISEKNLKQMDENGIGYILMLRTNYGLYDALADSVIDFIRGYKYELNSESDDEIYGTTQECKLYENGPICRAQIIWSASRYRNKRSEVIKELNLQRKKLEDFIEKSSNVNYTEKDLKWVPNYFKLNLEPGKPIRKEKRKRGKNNSSEIVEIPTFVVKGYSDNEEAINRQLQKAGIMIIVTSECISAQETVVAYSKRDCVEKTFQALKSHVGMDKIGVTTEEAMHGKGFTWFIASILHAILFNQTSSLRIADKKNYTVPAMVEQLEAIKADRNMSNNKWQRRYKVTKRQQNILGCFKINESEIDEYIANLNG